MRFSTGINDLCSRIHRFLTWEINSDIGLSFFRTSTPGYMAGGPIRQPYAGVDFIRQSGIYEFGH
jgi:hypothetical protein